MPPRRREQTQDESSYDGVPTVNVVLDAEPEVDEPDPAPVEVVDVPVEGADDDAVEDST